MIFFLLLSLSLFVNGEEIDCPENQFYNKATGQCQNCTKCQEEVPHWRLCSRFNDTICGIKIKVDFFDAEERRKEVTPVVLAKEDSVDWKNLAFSLIGLLSVLVIVTTITVLVTCYRFRHTGWFCKQVAQDQEDIESGYVVIHKFIPDTVTACSEGQQAPASPNSSPEQTHPFVQYQQRRHKPYRPKRRLLNEFVDDVFESDDSGGSRTLRLPTIPEKSEGT